MDRVRAVRFAVRSIQQLESFAGQSPSEIDQDINSVSVIGIRGAQVKFSPMETVETRETDWKHRRPKQEHWMGLTGLGDLLAGRPRKIEKHPDIKAMPL
jgi:6-phosphofructokinase 1